MIGGDVLLNEFYDRQSEEVKSANDVGSNDKQKLLNLYLLNQSKLYIGHTQTQRSRRIKWSSTINGKCISTLFRNFSPMDINIYKSIRVNKSIIPFEVILQERRMHNIHMGLINHNAIEVTDNTEEELLEAAKASIKTFKTGYVEPKAPNEWCGKEITTRKIAAKAIRFNDI